MPKGDKPTIKQRKFVKEYIETGNGTQSALKVYDTKDYMTAAMIASENLKKPKVIELLEDQASVAMLDQIEIRKELKESKTDYAVRSGVNKDILDRAGVEKDQPKDNFIQINVYNSEQARRLADRILQDGMPKGEE